MAVCAHARYLLRMFSSLPAPRAAAAASLYPAGAVVPPSFPALLPKPKPRQRKPPSKMQRPQQPLVRTTALPRPARLLRKFAPCGPPSLALRAPFSSPLPPPHLPFCRCCCRRPLWPRTRRRATGP